MAGPRLSRRAALTLPLAAAACAGEPQPETPMVFEPLRYDYLNPIALNVASVEVESRFVPASDDLGQYDPVNPVGALEQIGRDRLQGLGSGGRAVLAVLDASLLSRQGIYVGNFAVQLELYASDGTR